MGKSIILTKEQEEKIIYNYTVLRYGQKKSGAFIPVSDKIVKKVLLKHNIPIKNIQETNVNKYFINHNYFKEQSEDVGYWIGILGSDGSVNRNKNEIYIELQRQDRELLEKLNSAIENQRPIRDYETARGYENSKIYFYSAEIKKDLKEFKIIPNKTYDKNYGFPFKLNKEYYKDYLRGLFDGDGNISTIGGTIRYTSTSLKLIKDIREVLWSLGYSSRLFEEKRTELSAKKAMKGYDKFPRTISMDNMVEVKE